MIKKIIKGALVVALSLGVGATVLAQGFGISPSQLWYLDDTTIKAIDSTFDLEIDDLNAATVTVTAIAGAVDLDGNILTLDADGDTDFHAGTDDVIDINIAGAKDFTFSANAFNVLSGSSIKTEMPVIFTTGANGADSAYYIGRDEDDSLRLNTVDGEGVLFTVENSPIFSSTSRSPIAAYQQAMVGGAPVGMVFNGGAHTNLTLGTEATDIYFNLSRVVQWNRGALTTQRAVRWTAPTWDMSSASADVTNAIFMEIAGAPSVNSTNINFTNTDALKIGGNASIGAAVANKTYDVLDIPAHTVTITGTTSITGTPSITAHRIGQLTITDASAVTVAEAASLYIDNAPTTGGSVTLTKPLAFKVGAGNSEFGGRVVMAGGRIVGLQPASIASASNLTLTEGNVFEITGTTSISGITTAGWQNGSTVTLMFSSTATVRHNTAGGAGTALIFLAGAANFSATANDTLTLVLSTVNGTQAWREIGRAAI